MKLYGVVMAEYGSTAGTPRLLEAEVARETPVFYFFDQKSEVTRFSRRVAKSLVERSTYLALTAEAAWDKALAGREAAVDRLAKRLERLQHELVLVRRQRAEWLATPPAVSA